MPPSKRKTANRSNATHSRHAKAAREREAASAVDLAAAEDELAAADAIDDPMIDDAGGSPLPSCPVCCSALALAHLLCFSACAGSDSNQRAFRSTAKRSSEKAYQGGFVRATYTASPALCAGGNHEVRCRHLLGTLRNVHFTKRPHGSTQPTVHTVQVRTMWCTVFWRGTPVPVPEVRAGGPYPRYGIPNFFSARRHVQR